MTKLDKQLAYNALERITVGREASPEKLKKADSDFDLLLKNKLDEKTIKEWAAVETEYQQLNETSGATKLEWKGPDHNGFYIAEVGNYYLYVAPLGTKGYEWSVGETKPGEHSVYDIVSGDEDHWKSAMERAEMELDKIRKDRNEVTGANMGKNQKLDSLMAKVDAANSDQAYQKLTEMVHMIDAATYDRIGIKQMTDLLKATGNPNFAYSIDDSIVWYTPDVDAVETEINKILEG